MPELLPEKLRDQLATWIGKTCHFRLLYKISRHKCSAETFHKKCDGQGPTVTVLYNTNNTIYGGYLSKSWNSNGSYISDSNAFLFRLQYNGSFNPVKADVNDSKYANAAYGQRNYGPTFGGNYDLHSFSGTISKTRHEFALNGSLNMSGGYYNYIHQDTSSMTNNNLNVTNLEVYLVADGPDPKFSDAPWRESAEWNEESAQNLRQSLIKYKPVAEVNVPAANILLVGQIGAGKSSFFNSVNSIFRGKITSKACSGSFEHSVTTAYRQYEIKDFSSGKFLNFHLCDTRGFEEEFEMDAQEISFILDGNVPDRYQFQPMVPFTRDTPGYVKEPDIQDKIHCVAFVVDGSTVDVMPEKVRKQLKDLQVKMNQRNIPQVVLLTKLDKICPDVENDITNTFTSFAVYDAVVKVAEIMGLPRAHILPIKNYESEINLKIGVDILLMEALQRCLDFADDSMDEQFSKLVSEGKKTRVRRLAGWFNI
ncbi:interferon-induced protein 44-like [Ostrea edulis]|uniref:interferon-induced protein 44-like n=1 Tax=Ostrea edulis TaxID=37623 RepID=UPI0024AFE31A|nr:interferon-induced protein 44-like [Ostrea edulis]